MNHHSKNLFNLKNESIPIYHLTRSKVKNVFDVCFLVKFNNQAFVVVSANLTITRRDAFAHPIIKYIF